MKNEYGPRSTDPGYHDLTPVQQAYYQGYDAGWYARGVRHPHLKESLYDRLRKYIASKGLG